MSEVKFEWPRIHKWEENIEREVTDAVYQYVLEHFGVDSVEELTEEQMNAMDDFRYEQLSEYSLMQIGFSNLYGEWEMLNEEI